MLPQILRKEHYGSFLDLVDESGANKTVHMATLKIDGGGTFVCKIMRADTIDLGNEIIGYILAKAAKVPSPPRAAVLIMPASEAREILPIEIPPHLLAPNGNLVMWCTEKMNYRTHKAQFRASEARTNGVIELLRHETAQRMAALDQMTGNSDRNDGNFLWISKSECAAIDHEWLFNKANWYAGPMKISSRNDLLEVARRHGQSSAGRSTKSIYENLLTAMVGYGEQHHVAVGKNYAEIDFIIGRLYGDHAAQNVLSSICERSFCQWMSHQLGII